jgi:subtilase family serine protease
VTLSDRNRLGLSVLAGLAVLTGCNAGTSSTAMIPQTGGVNASHACPQVVGQASCAAEIESPRGSSLAVTGWTPADFQAHYKLPSSSKGAGQIVAAVEAYDNPDVASNLATYRSEFGLGVAKFTKYNESGQTKNYPSPNSGWGVAIDLDVEMISASCPLCTIYLVEANTNYSSDLDTAEEEAVKLGAHIVSNSWGCSGSSPSCASESAFEKPGVEYLGAAGDSGFGFNFPAAFEHVAAIGATLLSKNGSQYSEKVLDDSGGCDTSRPRPPWQHDTFCNGRALVDASAVASGVAEYDTYEERGWLTIGGTAVPTPLLAGVFGLAGNASKQDGGRTFWGKKHRKDLYNVCGSSGCLFKQYSYGGGWGSPDGVGAF